MLLSALFARKSSVESRWRVAGIAVLNLCDQRCFQAHILVCSLRTLPREAVVTYLEPAPALFAEACARKGVLTVAHPPGSLAQRDLRGRRPSASVPSGKILAYLFLESLVSDLSLVQMGAGH